MRLWDKLGRAPSTGDEIPASMRSGLDRLFARLGIAARRRAHWLSVVTGSDSTRRIEEHRAAASRSLITIMGEAYAAAAELTSAWPASMRRAFVASMPAALDHPRDALPAALEAHRARGRMIGDSYQVALPHAGYHDVRERLERIAVDHLAAPATPLRHFHAELTDALADEDERTAVDTRVPAPDVVQSEVEFSADGRTATITRSAHAVRPEVQLSDSWRRVAERFAAEAKIATARSAEASRT